MARDSVISLSRCLGWPECCLPRGLPSISRWHTDPKLMSPHHRDPTDGANAVAKIFILSSLTSCTSIVKMPIITLCPLRTFFFKWECYFHAKKDADFFLPCVFLFSMKWFCLFNFKIMNETLITTCSWIYVKIIFISKCIACTSFYKNYSIK